MAYTVLARKYRSRTFDEVVGQDPIATTLKNAIAAGRIHHGYLFTGTRGVGKTSMARILAKALNCLRADGPTATPCLECDSCRAIAEGQDLDVIEIDAASNTGVDNIRELRSNANYRPSRARFKIYIIDEVHMLSTGAFNALLKTLEEPPEHVKFILATTEIQKVPATIQSRCQRFTFRNIDADAIAGALATVCQAENVNAEPAVLQRVARLGNGSMRDALSILDQLLSVSPGTLSLAVLEEVLPPPQNELHLELLEACAAGDPAAVLTKLDELLSGGRGLEVFCAEFIEVLRTLMLLRACGDDAAAADIPSGATARYQQLAAAYELSHFVQMIAAVEELRRNVRYSGAGRALTEVTLIRFSKLRAWTSIEQLLEGAAAPGAGGDEKKKYPVGDARGSAAGGSTDDRDVARAGSGTAPGNVRPLPVPAAAGARETATARRPGSSAPARRESAAAEPVIAERRAGSERGARTEQPRSAEVVARRGDATRDAAAAVGASGAALSDADKRELLADPVVSRVIDLFDGVLVHAERRGPVGTGPAAATAQESADAPAEVEAAAPDADEAE